MRELRFPKDVYLGEQVDAAIKTYDAFATIETLETDSAWVVRISASSRARERRVAGELGNHALGATIRHRKA